ncbi:MAG: bifunctional enoyl-CoA hydratase/phosphate acetyltransferase [Burkholderiales bacterium]|mgnify:FL=1|jgi:phosphate acetyltransferase|uniref:Enoyl-CoA hydratase n=1 Tax=Candidatus Desulfobacillus denitrificans TaxID=2608985 RepID=A0A809RLU0_9PROT|nr:bifunctional enoyl-CoA hydratase/phosphate acetyltransferase [Zoogloeaceae bacterium]MBP9654398.1 bifunctional enoyl-CoA hydratase/phosphate acetyltransferase [Rhodocyclaceae bacterium]MCZ2174889.1 bifunctional enoyl-CoA hydratase/phosphate acetyltransferase [Burkholderiales bacterium]OQY71431.1 MAG: enoyl-CoA hydratase [Rhodocyclaceae bacterium UTPRO2]BBO20462.1 enoyl-CoA hydratase [Candidatus Desulfobacillus denitrificans]GIK44465.1 MAG: bifunctional enoyl-CoA hydratase/phosphate acetyltr
MNAMEYIENRTFDEIQVGDSATLVRTLRPQDIQLFAIMSGDVNPAHVDPEYAKSGMFREVIAHGMWGGALISTVLGTQFPGPGTIYIDQTLHFSRPVGLGDTITVTLTATRKFDHNHHILFDCVCTNQDGQKVIRGTAEVLAPTEKVKRPRVELPEVTLLDREARYQHLLERTRGLAAIPMAVVHPCDKESLLGVVEATQAGLIIPTLVGPKAKILAVAEQQGVDLAGVAILDVEHSHAAADRAVALVREGRAEALMKGSLHTDELMGAVVDAATGLRTARRISHVFLADVPTYPKPLLITDAAINIEPDLECKADIVRNAIDLAIVLGIVEPKVAILAAVETVTPKMRSTLDAAALCKMADRGQIAGGVLDGPLAFDNAISIVAAKTKGILSAVAGRADILVVPDLESGNMLAKQLEYLAEALMTGVVVGARVPIVLTSRADTAETRAASCAIALLMAHAKRKAAK